MSELKVKIFADGAELDQIEELASLPYIKGFTTNPTLMRNAGVSNYYEFASQMLKLVPDYPVSFEVVSDEPEEIIKQAEELASWGDNVYVKIPVTTTKGEFLGPAMTKLSSAGVQLNVTAVFTERQVSGVLECLTPRTPSVVSVFAGRLADAGIDALPAMARMTAMVHEHENSEIIWASPRQIYNVVEAEKAGCDIITVSPGLLKKLPLLGKDLEEFSLDTVQMFYDDALSAGLTIEAKSKIEH